MNKCIAPDNDFYEQQQSNADLDTQLDNNRSMVMEELELSTSYRRESSFIITTDTMLNQQDIDRINELKRKR